MGENYKRAKKGTAGRGDIAGRPGKATEILSALPGYSTFAVDLGLLGIHETPKSHNRTRRLPQTLFSN